MNKYLLNSGLILIFLCFSTTLTVIALPDGFYFSTEIRKGNKYEWELTSNINNYVIITENMSSFYQGSKIVIEVTKDPINIEQSVIIPELADYFDETLNGVLLTNPNDVTFLINCAIYISGGVEKNYFEDLGMDIEGDEAYVKYETISGDDHYLDVSRYDLSSGILKIRQIYEVIDGEVKKNYKLEFKDSDEGLFGLDFSSFWFILPALMIPVIIKKRKND